MAGISRFRRDFLELVFAKAREDFQNGKMNYHYEECVFRTSQQTIPIHAVPGTDLAWIEIDTTADLQRAQELIFPRIGNKPLARC